VLRVDARIPRLPPCNAVKWGEVQVSERHTEESGHFHAVRFYKDAGSLAEIVCAFLAEGLETGAPAVLIASADHIPFFSSCFSTRGIDTQAAVARGTLVILDAEVTLRKFMRDGVPMAQRFTETIAPVLAAAAARHPGKPVRAFGEMVDVLWKRGETAAAIRLEMLWNDLARSHRFDLLCGYAMGSFYKGSSTDEICGLHSHVVTDEGAHVRFA
jgi:hypothetical protein